MLEKKLEDPSDENRIRLLGGEDPEPEVLAKKIEELELRLAEKEEKLLEKDLIFEEVTRLADRTKKKSETGKEDTLELAKKVCVVQRSLAPIQRCLGAHSLVRCLFSPSSIKWVPASCHGNLRRDLNGDTTWPHATNLRQAKKMLEGWEGE